MADRSEPSALEALRRDVAEKSNQLSELDLMLADYDIERIRLIHELRHLHAQLRNAEEQSHPDRVHDH